MDSWKKSKGFKHLLVASGSASTPNLAKGPVGDLAGGQSNNDPQLGQPSSGEPQSQQAALCGTKMSRSRRFLDKCKSGFRSSPPPPGAVEHRNSTPGQPIIVTSVSQSLAVSTNVLVHPHSSSSGTSALQKNQIPPCDVSLPTARGNVTAGGM